MTLDKQNAKGVVKMRLNKMVAMFLASILIIGTVAIPVSAVEAGMETSENNLINFVVTRATSPFNLSIPARSRALADSSFPMAAGETVTIKASYAPFEASVYFGLVDEDGVFHYFSVTGGSADGTILIEESGRYTLQIRNNSSFEVEVSGFVKY